MSIRFIKRLRKSNKFRDFLLEFLLIVFSVLFALLINEWQSNYREQRDVDKALQNIRAEIDDNREALEQVVEYHRKTARGLKRFLEADSLQHFPDRSLIQLVHRLLPRGLNPAHLSNYALASTRAGGTMQLFDYQTNYLLSRLYDTQEEGVNYTWKIVADQFLQPIAYDPEKTEQALQILHFSLDELYQQEIALKDMMEKTLEDL